MAVRRRAGAGWIWESVYILGRMGAEPLPAEAASTPSTWQHLDDLVEEIAGLAQSDLAPREFWRRLLDRAVRALAAAGGAVWLRGAAETLSLECQINLAQAPWGRPSPEQHGHRQLIAHVRDSGLAISLPPHSGSPGHADGDNPSAFLLLLSPVVADGQTLAVVEILKQPGDFPAAPDGYLRFLSAACELAADYCRQQQLRALRASAAHWERLENFAQAVHGGLDLRHVAHAIANDGRQVLGCDRLSVAVLHGRKARLAAVSGVDAIDRRAAGVRRLEQLIAAVLATSEPLVHPEDSALLPPQIESALEAYLDQSQARRLTVLPLSGRADEGAVVGALVVEDFSGAADETARQQLPAVASHGATALANALEYGSVPLVNIWRGLGLARWLVRRRQLPKTLLAVAGIAAAAAALVLVPVDFTVEGRGELLPKDRREVFAPSDGVVDEVHVAQGTSVAAGGILVVMRKPQLEFERTRVMGEMQTARKRLESLKATRLGSAAGGGTAAGEAREQYLQRTAEEEETKELLKSLEEQLDVLKRESEELTVRSPIAGQVLTWDVAQTLSSRPVRRGQLLVSIGDIAGPWELELRVADDRIGHVFAAQQEAGADLAVTFLLATDPDHQYEARIADVGMTTVTDEADGPQVLVTAHVDREAIPRLRPGASVVAKIRCGRRSLGYVWLHDIWDTIRTRVLF